MLERFSYYLKQIVFNGEIVHVTKKDQAEKKYNTHTGTMLCFALLNIDFSEEEKDDFSFPKQTWSFLLLLN